MQGASGDERSRLSWERSNTEALALMGISNLHAGGALALGRADGSAAAGLMRWDLVNPWARLYELNSTHPLTALRIQALNEEARSCIRYPSIRCPRIVGGAGTRFLLKRCFGVRRGWPRPRSWWCSKSADRKSTRLNSSHLGI